MFCMSYMEIPCKNYKVIIEEPQLYVDNKSRGRSGHMTHALAEFAPGCFIDFNSNCSPVRWSGHSPYGWVEYRISKDCGKTYSETKALPYSVDCFKDGLHMISVEKAVACDDGTIVAFCLRNDGLGPTCCEPWDTPRYVISRDGGETWSAPAEFSPYKGRTYAALYHDGRIYALHLCNERFTGKDETHLFRIYCSDDNGASFYEHCVVPIEPIGKNYGAMIFDNSGVLHVYCHNDNDNFSMDHAISYDCGSTWTVCEPCKVEKGIRNPQVALLDGVFLLHARTEDYSGFVLYTSEDGYCWDEGTLIVANKGAAAFYSNNLNLTDEKGNFLLVQYSDRYVSEQFPEPPNCRVNVMHMNLRIKK